MEYTVYTETDLEQALKASHIKDCIWIKPEMYNANQHYIKTFAKNRKLRFQECWWGRRAVQLTFY